jgi:hypothetical protein
MNEIVDFLSKNPAYGAVAGVLIVIGAFSLFKKLLKTAIVVGIVFFGYCFYLHSEGKALPTAADAQRVLDHGKELGGKLQKEAQQVAKDAQQAAQNVAQARSKVEDASAKLGGK